jgi:hypothetical protein
VLVTLKVEACFLSGCLSWWCLSTPFMCLATMLFLGGWGQVVVRLQNLYEVVLCDFTKDMLVETKIRDSAPYEHQANGQDSELPVELPSADNHSFFKQLKRLQTTLSTKESLFNVPKGLEARRRISFFSNSLFMTMPRAPSVLNISNSELCKLLQFYFFFFSSYTRLCTVHYSSSGYIWSSK